MILLNSTYHFIQKSLFLLGLLLSYFSFGQVQSKISPDVILMGDTASLNLVITADTNQKIILPQVKDSLNKYLEINEIKVDSTKIGRNLNLHINYTLTGFEPGDFLVNSLPIVIDNDTILSPSQRLKINDVEVNQAQQDFFPIKPIMEENITWWERNREKVLYGIGALILAGLLLTALWYWFRKRKKSAYISNPLLPPYEEAMQNLNKLDQAQYLQNRQYDAFYTDLSFILRRYFTRRFDFPANALLSSDLPAYMEQKEMINSKESTELTEFLKDADLAKFAKTIPAEEKHSAYRNWTEKIINHTKPLLENIDENLDISAEETEKLRKIDNS